MIGPDSSYLRSERFLSPLGLPAGTALTFSLLGQGEYNINYRFTHPDGRKLVLRINTGSQMHLEDQIGYEFSALQALLPSGRTPAPLFCDRDAHLLVMELLPGRPLRYESDLEVAAEILADIHALPAPKATPLLHPAAPAAAIYQECLEMAAQYLHWENASPEVCALLQEMAAEIRKLPLESPSTAPCCIVNTELNSGNFLINEGGHSWLVDWEKPLLSEPAQDLGHFLAPTTTFWKTDTILSPEQAADFTARYMDAIGRRMDTSSLRQRLPLFLSVTCLRGVSWCAMALREYSQPGRALVNESTRAKLRAYLEPEFLTFLLDNYIRRDFLR